MDWLLVSSGYNMMKMMLSVDVTIMCCLLIDEMYAVKSLQSLV